MNIKFNGTFKSITPFSWDNVPPFTVITGLNGAGKSHLLELVYYSLVDPNQLPPPNTAAVIENDAFKRGEVKLIKGEWSLPQGSPVGLGSVQAAQDSYFQQFISNNDWTLQNTQPELYDIFQKIRQVCANAGKQPDREIFNSMFPPIFFTANHDISQKLGEFFYDYRLSEIDLLSEGLSQEEVKHNLGEQPWIILNDIIQESKLPFVFNDPSALKVKDTYNFTLTHTISGAIVPLDHLSSGEKVLFSMVLYLYTSQAHQVFPRLLLMDEPDAHLHPSMCHRFINVVNNVLVEKYNVRVIMTTHSPSTIMMCPFDSIYEMSSTEPRIQKSPSKNHATTLLTAGLVYVGEGTKYYLVEDNEDVDFYTYVHSKFSEELRVDTNIPLVFIPASTKDTSGAKEKSGGKDVVRGWVRKLQESGLVGIVNGLIDADSGNEIFDGVHKIDRYSIENYLADPILVYSALLDKGVNHSVTGVPLGLGDEYKLKIIDRESLQKIADSVFDLVEPHLENVFKDFNPATETVRKPVEFTNGIVLDYPIWLFERRGKTLINELYIGIFQSKNVNFKSLFRALKKLSVFPIELASKFNELKK